MIEASKIKNHLFSGNQTYTYLIDGKDAFYIAEGDLHEEKYDAYEEIADLNLNYHPQVREVKGHCIYKMKIYPTEEFEKSYRSSVPILYACLTALTFSLLFAFFYIYNFMVQRRNLKMIDTAARSNAIVTSMFPDAVRDRLLGDDEETSRPFDSTELSTSTRLGSGMKMKRYISTGNCDGDQIAQLFLDSTVIFMDICGFTAWSSTRHPDQVFTLLQNVYREFDRVAKVRRVFKIETIGDCWVGVVGVPEPIDHHSVIAVQFAKDCIFRMRRVTRQLEVELGPDTGELGIRVGIHSGPVTAGVLKGDRARFQLFGDTVNTTARLESTGKMGRIHISQATAENIIESGKEGWVVEREDRVFAKGKGELVTFWVKSSAVSSRKPSENSNSSDWPDALIQGSDGDFFKLERLINWNVAILLPILKRVM